MNSIHIKGKYLIPTNQSFLTLGPSKLNNINQIERSDYIILIVNQDKYVYYF